MNRKWFERYTAISFAVGFYRGWNAKYSLNEYDEKHPIRRVHYNLAMEQWSCTSLRALMNGCLYATVGQPYAIYRGFCRLEIQMMDKDPYKHLDAYREALSYTSLPPKEDLTNHTTGTKT